MSVKIYEANGYEHNVGFGLTILHWLRCVSCPTRSGCREKSNIRIAHPYLNKKLDMPNLVTYLNWTPIFEWYAVGCCSKSIFNKDASLKEIGLDIQNNINNLGSTINIMWERGPIWPFNEHKNLHFDIRNFFHTKSEYLEESGDGLHLELLTISYTIIAMCCIISLAKWDSPKKVTMWDTSTLISSTSSTP